MSNINIKPAVDQKLKQMDAKIEWHKDQIKLINDAKRYWKNLLQDVESLAKQQQL